MDGAGKSFQTKAECQRDNLGCTEAETTEMNDDGVQSDHISLMGLQLRITKESIHRIITSFMCGRTGCYLSVLFSNISKNP